jgi:DNA polymerase
MNNEEYINDERFEVIGVAVKEDDKETQWHSGTYEQIKNILDKYNWEESICLAHNTKFDGAILKWKFDIEPKFYIDTMNIGSAITPYEPQSLAHMVEYYGVGVKGDVVHAVSGMRREDFNTTDLKEYAEYCKLDVDLTYHLFNKFITQYKFPLHEIKLINLTHQMYINSYFEVDVDYYTKQLEVIEKKKFKAIFKARSSQEELNSNKRFENLLATHGVEPLTSYSKDNPEFMALANHHNRRVRDIFHARLLVKSNQGENRIKRLIDIGKRHTYFPVELKYRGTFTGRWSGTGGTNFQNFPRQDKALKTGLKAPEGWVVINADSSQIEARITAWWSEQDDVVEQFKNNVDAYKVMASKIYKKPVEEVTPDERFIGKQAVLGCGFGMGFKAFKEFLENKYNLIISYEEANIVVKTFRHSNSKIVEAWTQCNELLRGFVLSHKTKFLGRKSIVEPIHNGVKLPSGLCLHYYGIKNVDDDLVYLQRKDGRMAKTKIYGGKVVENIVQALARDIIAFQIVNISKQYQVVGTVHDSIVCVVPKEERGEAINFINQQMNIVPAWADGLPVGCDIEIGENYGKMEATSPV